MPISSIELQQPLIPMTTLTSPPSRESSEEARKALRAFEPLTRRTHRRTVRLRAAATETAKAIDVPKEAFDLFLEILGQMANGNAVTLIAVNAELTTQQAAEILNVSRPHLVKLLEEKKIPFRQVGTHRRIRAEDLFRHKAKDEVERKRLLDELAAEAQKHKLGY